MNFVKCCSCGSVNSEKYFPYNGGRFICKECEGKTLNKELMSNDVRNHNVGNSDYSKHKIQPWDIWIEYKLNPFDADIIKRVLRKKNGDTRKMDYEKIIHICQERIRQIDNGIDI